MECQDVHKPHRLKVPEGISGTLYIHICIVISVLGGSQILHIIVCSFMVPGGSRTIFRAGIQSHSGVISDTAVVYMLFYMSDPMASPKIYTLFNKFVFNVVGW